MATLSVWAPLKHLVVICLASLLSACHSSLADLPWDKREKADFQATAVADLSDCVYRAAESMGSSYFFHLNARADKLEFLITATTVSDLAIQPKLAKLELHFMAKGETTTVEMRDRATGDHMLSRDLWSIVERCAEQVAKLPTTKPTAP
jgi:hypothetical protein